MRRNKRFAILRRMQCIAVGLGTFFAMVSYSFAVDSSLFVKKVMQNQTAEIEQLINDGADINSIDDDGNTGLHWAATFGYTAMAELLITKGADVNPINLEGNTPLHWAAGQGNTEIVKLLVANGADVNAIGKLSYTPLRWAEAMEQKSHCGIFATIRC